MEQDIYLDVYFLINFSMDLICFFIAARLLDTVFSPLRCVAASLLGGAYACVALLVLPNGYLQLLFDVLACALICLVAIMRRGQFRSALSFFVVYVAVSLALGGIMTALFSLYNRLGLDKLMGDENDADGLSVWVFGLMAALAGVAAIRGVMGIKRRGARRYGELEIEYGGRSVILKAICDSGNLLREPISGLPCVIVDTKIARDILPAALTSAVAEARTEGMSGYDMSRLRAVPTRTVSGDGILWAIRPDGLRLNMGRGWREITAYVALGDLGDGADGARALIPSSLAMGAP